MRIEILERSTNNISVFDIVGNARVGAIIEGLIQNMGLPRATKTGQPITYNLCKDGRVMDIQHSLIDAGIVDGDRIELVGSIPQMEAEEVPAHEAEIPAEEPKPAENTAASTEAEGTKAEEPATNTVAATPRASNNIIDKIWSQTGKIIQLIGKIWFFLQLGISVISAIVTWTLTIQNSYYGVDPIGILTGFAILVGGAIWAFISTVVLIGFGKIVESSEMNMAEKKHEKNNCSYEK
ncbi:MAG: EsaB/YukD family protein [Bacillota bacterium]|nr:EsaB/YukD family protein [Bacillota bacterium]